MNLMGKPPLGLKDRDAKDAPKIRKPVRRAAPAKRQDTADGPFVSQKLRDFARGRECQMKSEWCNGNSETTVLCHSRRRAGAGMAQKPHDWWAYHACSSCHANEDKLEDRELYDAIRRTQYAVYAAFGTLTP